LKQTKYLIFISAPRYNRTAEEKYGNIV